MDRGAIVLRQLGSLLLLAFSSIPVAQACSVVSPPIEEMIGEIASKGVMIGGAFVRSVDPANKQPEIIHADAVFIGNPQQREFVISRSDLEYERLAIPAGKGSGCGPRRLPAAGVAFARMILIPVEGSDTRNAGWQVPDFFPVEDSKYLDMLFDEAQRAGRFNERPPPIIKYWWIAKDPLLPLPK